MISTKIYKIIQSEFKSIIIHARTMPILVKQGFPYPLGVTDHTIGFNFSIFLENETSMIQLIVVDEMTQQLLFEGSMGFSTGKIRHLLLEGLPASFLYYYEINGKILLDPFAHSLATSNDWRNANSYCPKGYFSKSLHFFDWGEDKRPSIKHKDLIIYEMHVRGFSQDPSSNVKFPGTFLGVVEKIAFLKDLGVNAIELMPINEFYPHEYHPKNTFYEGKLVQYWGYSPVNYFCPMNRYSTHSKYGSSIIEFKKMVQALHKAGIEVILDMVFNHTSEGNQKGPTQSFKGFGKDIYYILDKDGNYANYSGCGNTFSCNHPLAIHLICEALRYWAFEMHVDGFRFDLASIFYRDEKGNFLSHPSVLEFITKDPAFSNIKLIAEPWDASGLYQVGEFYPESKRWCEWNARYRDATRSFIKGDGGLKGEFATRLAGSQDLYGHHRRAPQNSINFITSHDGFTLRDLVSYNDKHNFINGEFNRDGHNDNRSWNCGEEGPTLNLDINMLRIRQMRNLHLALLISQGIPMLYMGDEYGHSKYGNNNTWCQDNRLNWFLWDELNENKDFYRFYKGLILFRKMTPILKKEKFLTDDDIQWHGKVPFNPAWDIEDRFVAFQLLDPKKHEDLFIAFNASQEPTTIHFPFRKDNKKWKWITNTTLPLVNDYFEEGKILQNCPEFFRMSPFSSLLLQAH